MKQLTQLFLFSILAIIIGTATVSADSFGFYFGSDGFGVNLNIGDYDYYDRHSPGFYDSGSIDFHAALNPYGRWMYDIELGGDIWVPNVRVGWRPYSMGCWSYTQYGWTWVAYEPWGWIPHHYGNWIYHRLYGWSWVPGYVWAPARVTWGSFNGHYGWAPLPPRHCSAYYRRYGSYHRHEHHHHWYHHTNATRNPFMVRQEHGYYASDNDFYYRSIPNTAWVMVDQHDFTAGNIAEVAINTNRLPDILSRSRFEVLHKAPEKQMVERFTGKRINRIRVDETVKTVNGNKVKLVRPADILESQRKHVSKIQKQFKPQTINTRNNPRTVTRPKQTDHPINRSGTRHTINRPSNHNTINRPSNHKSINRPSNHNSVRKPARNQSLNQPGSSGNRITRSGSNQQLNRPTNHGVKRPAPKPQIQRPARNQQINKPAATKKVNKPKPEKKQPVAGKKKVSKKAFNKRKTVATPRNTPVENKVKKQGLKRLK